MFVISLAATRLQNGWVCACACACVFFSYRVYNYKKTELLVRLVFSVSWVNVVTLFLLLLLCASNDVKQKCYVILRFWRRKCHEIVTLARSRRERANIPSIVIVVYSLNRFWRSLTIAELIRRLYSVFWRQNSAVSFPFCTFPILCPSFAMLLSVNWLRRFNHSVCATIHVDKSLQTH